MKLQKFGIEIRKIGNIQTLYQDVDSILDGEVVTRETQTQTQAIAHALQKMIQSDGHFSICTIDRCLDICKIRIPKERYNIYHACHCLDWREMLPDFRNKLIAMILDDFRSILNPI